MLVKREQRRRSEYREQGFHIPQKVEVRQKEQKVPQKVLHQKGQLFFSWYFCLFYFTYLDKSKKIKVVRWFFVEPDMSIMSKLKQIIERSDTPHGRTFDLFIQALIVISLVSFSIETLPNISETMRTWLRLIEIFCVIVFSVEYLLRVYVATPKRKYIFSFFGIIDLVAILPFYLGAGIDLRSVRMFRLLRLFRIFKLARYNAAVRRFHRALIIAKEEIVLFIGVAAILLYLAAVGIYYFESDDQPEDFGSVLHCLWWAVATLTTVGYGDVYPITMGGRIFTFFILLIGLGVISVPAGLVASALAKARQMEEDS